MSGLACLLAAIALVQEPAPAVPPAEKPAAPPEPRPSAGVAPPPGTAPAPAASEPRPTGEQPAAAPTPPARAPEAAPAGARHRTPRAQGQPPVPLPSAASGRTAAGPAPRTPGDQERDDASRLASAFLRALSASDADALAALCAERFSFDGDLQSGREAIRRTWRAILAGRTGPAPAVGRIEVVPVAEAVARHGPPPARIAPLARPGALVAIADVGGRTVVLFIARDGGRLAVTGMHD